jgi:hypothetical protein
MGWTDIRAVLLGDWAGVSAAGLYFAAGLALAACSTWLLTAWRYGDVVSTLRARLKLAEDKVRMVDDDFGGASHAAAARLKRLESYLAALPPRRLDETQRRAIAAAPCPPAHAPYLTVVHDATSPEVDRYARDFVEAFSAAPGWNVVDQPFPKMPHPPCLGIAVGVSDPGNPTPTEQLVIAALAEAGVAYDLLTKTPHGADAQIVVSAR